MTMKYESGGDQKVSNMKWGKENVSGEKKKKKEEEMNWWIPLSSPASNLWQADKSQTLHTQKEILKIR